MQPFEDLLQGNRAHVGDGRHRSLPARPSRSLAVITCMDCRLNTFAALGLELGDAHVLRTAGARVSDDVLRSLTLSTHLLGTRSVAVIGHTDCGQRDPDDDLVERLTAAMGRRPAERTWYTFADPRAAIRADCALLSSWADRPSGLRIGGYLLDVADGRVSEVVAPHTAPELPN